MEIIQIIGYKHFSRIKVQFLYQQYQHPETNALRTKDLGDFLLHQGPLIPNQDCQIILTFTLTIQLTTYHRKYVCLSSISHVREYGWLVVGMQEKLLSPPSDLARLDTDLPVNSDLSSG